MKPPQTLDTHELAPQYCVWELTLACDLRCGHCGSKAGRPRPDEMDTEECLSVVRELADLGCQVITLSGGEPTLRPDWQEIAEAIGAAGMIANMVTNGFAMDAQLARRMKDAGLANVAVSIDGPKDVHEKIRGRGTFDRTCNAFSLLKEVGLSTTVMTTINTLNLHRLEEIWALAIDLGAARWRSQLGKAMGHMNTNDDLVIQPKDLLYLLPELHRLDQRGPIRVGIGDSIGFFGPYDVGLRAVSWRGTPQRWAGCQAGMRAIGIEANGGIKGCLSMQAFSGADDPFVEGNIRHRSLTDIWRDPNSFAYNRKFDPASLSGFCKGCKYRLSCRGGARCVAAAATGGLAEDPYCYHRVATLATKYPLKRLGRNLAVAASAMGMLCAGCQSYQPVVGPEYGVEPDPPDCEQVCCECDPDQAPEGAFEVCCEEEPIDCETVCCACDYGELPPGAYELCCEPVIGLDYGDLPPDECLNVCCDCDYGELPPDVREQCCESEPVDCQNVCCDCDYGELPPDVREECCESEPIDCQTVCCDCDYGELPPDAQEQCCQSDPIDCAEVCCTCEYGVLPPEVLEKCCSDEEP